MIILTSVVLSSPHFLIRMVPNNLHGSSIRMQSVSDNYVWFAVPLLWFSLGKLWLPCDHASLIQRLLELHPHDQQHTRGNVSLHWSSRRFDQYAISSLNDLESDCSVSFGFRWQTMGGTGSNKTGLFRNEHQSPVYGVDLRRYEMKVETWSTSSRRERWLQEMF